MLIARIGKQLDLFHCGRAIQSVEFEQLRDYAVNQRRTDGTFTNGKKFVRVEAKVSKREFGRSSQMKPCAIAVIPWRRGMQPNLGGEFDFCNPAQRFAQNVGLEFELPRVGNVLIMAPATLAEVGTAWLDAIGRRFDQLRERAARETRLFLPDL